MHEFLTLCGYEPHELESEAARVQRALSMVGLTGGDLARGKTRIRTFFDVELAGVRKMLGVILRDFTNTVLLRGGGDTKVVFSFMAPGCQVLGSALRTNYEHLAWIDPNYTFLVVLGSVFGKAAPILEAAEKLWLRAGGVGHCGNVKCAVGLLALDILPKPDLAVTSGFLCETSAKTVGLLEEWYGIPAYFVDCWQDRELGEYPSARRATGFYAKSLRRLSERVGDHFGVVITDEMIWEVLEARKPYFEARSRVQELLRKSDPVPLSSTHLHLLFALDDIPCRTAEMAAITTALDTLVDDLRRRTEQGVGATPRGAPRVLGILPCHHSDPRWEHLATQMGIAIVASDFELSSSERIGGAGLIDPDDPYDVIGQHMHSAAQQILGGRIALILDACRRMGLDGVLNHYHVGCRYVAGDALIIKDAVMQELGIPALTFEWDNFDPRSYDDERYKANLETFVEMMAGRPGRSGRAP